MRRNLESIRSVLFTDPKLISVNESLFLMGKNTDEEHNLPVRNGGGAASATATATSIRRCCFARICSCFSLRCVLVLVFSASVFLSALFWIPGLSDRRDLDLDPRFKDHRIVASFDIEKPVSFLEDNLSKLEDDITDEISFSMTKVVVLALEPLSNLNRTMVVFAIDPEKENSMIPVEIKSLIKAAFETLVEKQISLRLTESLFGQPFYFEVLKFPGGITVIPPQPIFPLQNAQILFNFTLNFSIYQIQSKFSELTSQLKKGINLAPHESLYITLSNSRGSTVSSPTTIHSSVLLTFGTSSRMKQLAQTITHSHSKNLGLNHTVFGKVKQVRLSSILPQTPATSSPSPSPSPQHRHELSPEPSPQTISFVPALAPMPTLRNPPCPYEQWRPKANNVMNHYRPAPMPAPHWSQPHPPRHQVIPVSSPLPHVVFAYIPHPTELTGGKTPSPSPTPSSASISPHFKRTSSSKLLVVIVAVVVIC